MVGVNVLNKSSRITISSKINQEFESFKMEFLPRLSAIEKKINELDGAILEQKKQKCELENRFSGIDEYLRESISLFNQLEGLRSDVERLKEEVVRLKVDEGSSTRRIDIEGIVREVTGGRI